MRSRFDGLSEFISRQGRMKILALLLEKSESAAEIARKLDVARTAVYGWQNKRERHPNNEHTREMLRILSRTNKNEVKEILLGELRTFEELISSHFQS